MEYSCGSLLVDFLSLLQTKLNMFLVLFVENMCTVHPLTLQESLPFNCYKCSLFAVATEKEGTLAQ